MINESDGKPGPETGKGPSGAGAVTQSRQTAAVSAPERAAVVARVPAPSNGPQPSTAAWPVRGPLLLGAAAILLLLGGFGAWAGLTTIAGAVVATGQVEVDQNRQVIQHIDGGVVDEILVKNGDNVLAGTPLLRLDGTLLRSERTIVEGQFYELLARSGRLEAERDDRTEVNYPETLLEGAALNAELAQLMNGQTRLFAARAETLSKTLEQLEKRGDQTRSQIEGVDAQIIALGIQFELIGRELTDQRTLFDRGLAQASRVLALEREAAALQGELGELQAARAQAEGRLTEIDLERLRLANERSEAAESELRDIGYRVLELAERRRALSGQIERLELRAPVSGVVHAMEVTTPRSVIRPADPVLYLVPQDRPMVIAARIATINIDEVAIGQQVRLRFSAFSSRTTPEVFGQVVRVSPDALVDETTGMPYYRAEIMLDPSEHERLGALTLIPGMPVEVYLRTGERSPIAYLVKPLSDYFNRAFRES